jgi:hypothetical protein
LKRAPGWDRTSDHRFRTVDLAELGSWRAREKVSTNKFFFGSPGGEGSKSTARAAYIRNLKASQRRNSSIGYRFTIISGGGNPEKSGAFGLIRAYERNWSPP